MSDKLLIDLLAILHYCIIFLFSLIDLSLFPMRLTIWVSDSV